MKECWGVIVLPGLQWVCSAIGGHPPSLASSTSAPVSCVVRMRRRLVEFHDVRQSNKEGAAYLAIQAEKVVLLFHRCLRVLAVNRGIMGVHRGPESKRSFVYQ